MTTIGVQVKRLNKILNLNKTSFARGSFIPPQLIQECKGIVFFKKLSQGPQDIESSGVMFKRLEDGKWGCPVSLHFAEGQVSYLKFGENQSTLADIIILLNDINAVKVFEVFGQVGFDVKHYMLEKGPIVNTAAKNEDAEVDLIDFVNKCSIDPSYLVSNSFAFANVNNHWRGCTIKNSVFQTRDSSNCKFYSNKLVTSQIILNDDGLTSSIEGDKKLVDRLSKERICQLQLSQSLLNNLFKQDPKTVSEHNEVLDSHGFSKKKIKHTEEKIEEPVQTEPVFENKEITLSRRLSFTF